jgi:hypothetical protein
MEVEGMAYLPFPDNQLGLMVDWKVSACNCTLINLRVQLINEKKEPEFRDQSDKTIAFLFLEHLHTEGVTSFLFA